MTQRRAPWAEVADSDWGDWGWQFRNRIHDLRTARAAFRLTAREVSGLEDTGVRFRFGVTPYYAELADPTDDTCAIRRQIIPIAEEAWILPGHRADPLGEEPREVVPNLVHRYPDRVLLLSTDRCPVYCRFCTRRRIVGRLERQSTRSQLFQAYRYIRANREIKEVIVSGGDALMLGDNQLTHILSNLRAIPHVEIIRVATRMPVTCPMRITERLVERLRRYGPIYVMTHFNHPRECTTAAEEAVARMVDSGLVVYNQSVLLAGINDRVSIFRELNRRLVRMRITPYYLHQCDMAEGIEHFRTPLSKGLEIIEGLRGHQSGLAVPQFCVDVPGGLGKITLVPEWTVERGPDRTRFRTYTGEIADYADPRPMAPNDDVDSPMTGP
ncbi:MAG: KamA family radical SAM protein [Myxococcota bacterium]